MQNSGFLRYVAVGLALATVAVAAEQRVAIRFEAVVGSEKFACGQTYKGVVTTASTLTPRDFRFYVQGVELLNASGKAVAVDLDQDGKWQLDDVALLDFEDGTAGCINGTPDLNFQIAGSVPEGHYSGLRFVLAVPFNKNHTDLTTMPPPLNLTALSWVWNAGRKFARLDIASTGLPRGYAIHIGSTGCTPNETKITVPTECSHPNRSSVELPGFNPATDVVVADLGSLLKNSNIDENQPKTPAGCMSGPDDSDCAALFASLGLPFGDAPAGPQRFFRRGLPGATIQVAEAAGHGVAGR